VIVAGHSAKSLFDKNIESAKDCLTLFDGVSHLDPKGVDLDWILRAAVVFVVSALDTYFHDKVKYRVGKFSLHNLPPALAKFEVAVARIASWDKATRKGNVLRNWVTKDLGTKPLQSPERIAEALKLAGIDGIWATIEPDTHARKQLLDQFNALMKRRHQIAHEGDREQSRKSGKKVRKINRDYVTKAIEFAETLVDKIENAFPK
jgi:hypothetical protein